MRARAIHHINDVRYAVTCTCAGRGCTGRRQVDAATDPRGILLTTGTPNSLASSWNHCTTSTRAIQAYRNGWPKPTSNCTPRTVAKPPEAVPKALSAESVCRVAEPNLSSATGAAASGSLDRLRHCGKTPVVTMREDEAFLVDYAIAPCDCEAIDDAEALLARSDRPALEREAGGRLRDDGRGNAIIKQLAAAEGWLAARRRPLSAADTGSAGQALPAERQSPRLPGSQHPADADAGRLSNWANCCNPCMNSPTPANVSTPVCGYWSVNRRRNRARCYPPANRCNNLKDRRIRRPRQRPQAKPSLNLAKPVGGCETARQYFQGHQLRQPCSASGLA